MTARHTPIANPSVAEGAAAASPWQRWRWPLLIGAGAALCALGAGLGASGFALVRSPTDFGVYYAAARVLAAGGDPYNWHALRQVVPEVPALGYIYPLWSVLPILPLTWLPLPEAAGVWLILNLACLALAVGVLASLVGLPGRSYWLPALSVLTCLSIPGLFVLIQGQISIMLLAAVLGAFWAAVRGRGAWTGVLIALALVKPQLTWLPALVILAVAWRHGGGRAAIGTASACLALFALVSFALRPDWLGQWIFALREDAAQGGSGAQALRANMGTIPALAAHLPPPLGVLLLALSLMAGAALLIALGRRALSQSEPRDPWADATLLAVAIGVGTALSPWMWIYDGVFWLVPLALAVARGPAWRRWASVVVFWLVPWSIRLWHVASAGGSGTSLNKLEDVVIAPLLIALLLITPRTARAPLWLTPAFAKRLATRWGQRT